MNDFYVTNKAEWFYKIKVINWSEKLTPIYRDEFSVFECTIFDTKDLMYISCWFNVFQYSSGKTCTMNYP